MRELQARWMINGPGGYTEHRFSLPIPSLYELILGLSLIVLAWEVWRLWKG